MSKKKKDTDVVDENIADEIETIEIETADISSDEDESLKEDESIEEEIIELDPIKILEKDLQKAKDAVFNKRLLPQLRRHSNSYAITMWSRHRWEQEGKILY